MPRTPLKRYSLERGGRSRRRHQADDGTDHGIKSLPPADVSSILLQQQQHPSYEYLGTLSYALVGLWATLSPSGRSVPV